MQTQDNINLVRRLFDFFNKNDVAHMNECDQLVSSNIQIHDPAATNAKSGKQGFIQLETGYTKAFPNKKIKIDNMFSTDDQVVVRWTCTGTHRGQYQGIAPTNKEFKIQGISIYRVTNGRISEIWQVWDHYGLLEQLGELRIAHAVH